MSLVPTETTGTAIQIDQAGVLKALNLNPNDPKTQALLLVCDKYGLDPVLKHMVLIQGTPYITRDGLMHNAHNSGQFDGIEVVEQGETNTHWTAKVAVYRKDMGRPIAYTGRYPKGGSNKEYGPEMAVKCAEVAALRRAFNITGIATREEQWDLVDVDGFDRAPLATPDQAEQISRLAAHLDDDQRAVMAAFRDEHGISMRNGEFTAEHAKLVIARLEQLLDGDGDGDGPDGGGGAPVPEPEASGPDGPGVADQPVREAEQAAGEPDAHPGEDPAAGSPPAPQDSGPVGDPQPPAGSDTHAGGGEPVGQQDQQVLAGEPERHPPAAPSGAPTTDLQDVLDLVDGVTGFKQKGPRESKIMAAVQTVADDLGVDVPPAFDDLDGWEHLGEVFLLLEQRVAAISGASAPAAGDPSGGDPPASSEGEPATREQTQQALIMRIQQGSPRHGRERHDAARHALIRHVTEGRTESSREASKDELLAAHRLLDEVEAGTVELHLRANGEYEVRARRGTAA